MKRFSQLAEDLSSRDREPRTPHNAPIAIFVTGGPGSGKDIVVRECITEQSATELNFIQAIDCLNDKHMLSEKTSDVRREGIRTRQNLIINGPADDLERIVTIKEELEDLGYDTKMIFISTTNESSKKRNSTLRRMMSESIRQNKWSKSQYNRSIFKEMFDDFIVRDNSKDLTNPFTMVYESRQSSKNVKVLADASPFMQNQATKGKIDDIKFDAVKQNKDFIYGKYSESNQPTLVRTPEPKISRFNMDKDRSNAIKRGDKSLSTPKAIKPDSVGSSYNSRMGGGSSAAGAGLGNQTYSESVGKKTLKRFRESIDSPCSDMGVSGVNSGSSKQEPMVTPMDKYGQSGITIKKKKQEQK